MKSFADRARREVEFTESFSTRDEYRLNPGRPTAEILNKDVREYFEIKYRSRAQVDQAYASVQNAWCRLGKTTAPISKGDTQRLVDEDPNIIQKFVVTKALYSQLFNRLLKSTLEEDPKPFATLIRPHNKERKGEAGILEVTHPEYIRQFGLDADPSYRRQCILAFRPLERGQNALTSSINSANTEQRRGSHD